MSDAHGITNENLMLAFPYALRESVSISALGNAAADALAKRPSEIGHVSIYSRIDELREDLLDILAHDFKVDWWDPNYNLEEKRRVFKSSWYVHKHMGTKAAVVTAVSAIYPETKVEEWFKYGGRPYGFKIHLNMTGEKWDEERPRRILERVEFYKSLRSHLDALEYTTILPPTTIHIGGAPGAITRMGIPEAADAPVFRTPLHAGGTFGVRQALPVPEDTSPPSATTILRVGGVCTIISNLSRGNDT